MSNSAEATILAPLGQSDEISPIAAYILKEMASNAGGRDALQILGLNSTAHADCVGELQAMPWWQELVRGPSLQLCIQTAVTAKSLAYARWGLQVRQNGPWDHKPHIAKHFPALRPYHHHYHGRTYYYDIWSNIHYGYVGRACGFTRGELLDGAGSEQNASNLRRFDDPSDRRAIQVGIDLYPQLPSIPTLLQILKKTPGLSP